MKEQLQLRWYHFLISWLLCLLTGTPISMILIGVTSGASEAGLMGLLVTIVAAAISAPFIIVFCLLIHFWVLKKVRSKSEIHALVFLLHALGSILVFFGIVLFADDTANDMGVILIGITFGYFALDSLFFHSFIQKKAVNVGYEQTTDADLLDQKIDIEVF
jgi:hypothetical protein